MSICRILLVMPAASVAIASALRKNHSLGKTFWFTYYQLQISDILPH
ncbi:hypothetical protein NIES806_29450 [Dolichospermum compactum NIES-806]|uniref:Uncharacterized protein n=1 Tax=Dolichospermum compactum NIES-806 TaxID=1973481 RepID=A0A1Z4V5W2_9CYAN|nr:hypothetical protein NIES806_29450 [Dolichospermum compactum NIES-806]